MQREVQHCVNNNTRAHAAGKSSLCITCGRDTPGSS